MWPFINLLTYHFEILCLLVLSAENLCKQFGPRLGPKLFDTKNVSKKLILKKKKTTKLPSRQRVIPIHLFFINSVDPDLSFEQDL